MSTVPLNIFTANIDTVMLDFSSIKVFKSVTGEDGALIDLTADTPSPAILPAIVGNYEVAGLTLSISVDLLSQVDILFTGTGVLTPAQVADQINIALGKSVASDTGTSLLLTSTTTGTGSKILINGGSAAALFGWSEGDYDGGEESRVILIAGQQNYTFLDKDGDSSHLYKVQYYNASTGLSSGLSEFFNGGVSTLVPAENLSVATIDLVDGQGVAVADQAIYLYPQREILSVSGYQVALSKDPIKMITNNAGHAEISLVRGLKLRVVIEGTSVIREIVVPDADEFDLLETISTGYDPFSITRLPFNAALRRSI